MLAKAKNLMSENWNSIIAYFNSLERPLDWFISQGSFFLLGLSAGFLIKHYLKYFLFGVLFAVFFIWGLQYYNIISIDVITTSPIYLQFSTATVHDLIALLSNLFKQHMFESSATVLGLLFAIGVL